MRSASKTRQFTRNFPTLSLDHNLNFVICSSSNGHQHLPEFMSRKRKSFIILEIQNGRGHIFSSPTALRFIMQKIYIKENWSVIMRDV